MATKIKMLSDWKNRKAGEVWSASDATAKNLVEAEIAEVFSEDNGVAETSVVEVAADAHSSMAPTTSSTDVEATIGEAPLSVSEVPAIQQPLCHRHNRRGHNRPSE